MEKKIPNFLIGFSVNQLLQAKRDGLQLFVYLKYKFNYINQVKYLIFC